MSETWWKVNGWDYRIERVFADKSSEKCVWIEGQRINVRSQWDNYFSTYAKARQYIIDGARRQHESATRSLEIASKELAEAERIPPFPPPQNTER